MAKIQLIVTEGPSTGCCHEVGEGGVTVGRSSRADFRIDDPMISRLHFKCYVKDGCAYVFDMESANGTILNGRELEEGPNEILDGDVISIGESAIRVEIDVSSAGEMTQKVAPVALSSLDALNQFSAAQELGAVSSEPLVAPAVVSVPEAAPQGGASVPAATFDLGLSEAPQEEEVEAPVENNGSARTLIIALGAFLVVIIALVVMAFAMEKGAQVPAQKTAIDSFAQTVAKPSSFYMSHEHLQIRSTGVFQCLLTYDSEYDELSLNVYEIGRNQRVVAERKNLSRDDAKRFKELLKNFKNVRSQEDEIREDGYRETFKTTLVIDTEIYSRAGMNRITEDYQTFCSRIEDFALMSFNIEEFVQLSIEELIAKARALLDDAELYERQTNLGGEMLYNSYKAYRSARAYLKTVNPKPDFNDRIEEGFARTKKEIDTRYQKLKLDLSQARTVQDRRAECEALNLILRLIPDLNDERYKEAARDKERLESQNLWF